MPIKTVERQLDEQGVLGNFPRMGKLHKGAEKTDKGTVGRDQDYFRLSLEPQYEQAIRPAFVQLFGNKPMQFNNVLIAADSADMGFKYWYEQWAHARLLRRCDGEDIVVQFSEGEQRYTNQPTNCSCNPLNRDCHERGTMDIVIPALFDLTGMWGKFTILTGSVYDIIALRSSMKIAGVFHAKMENLSFWSIPFRVGRAVRPVPVTINGKRSIKPMSLLYADIEPEFNQKVFMPMVTAPTQMLLNGINPGTGEMPEVIIEQVTAWDRDFVDAETLHLFDNENHQFNAIQGMIASGILVDDMPDHQVIEIITFKRAERDAEKQAEPKAKKPRKAAAKSNVEGSNSGDSGKLALDDLDWVNDPLAVNSFVSVINDKFEMSHDQIIRALQWVMDDYTIEYIPQFVGTKATAYAACLLATCKYNPDQVIAWIPDETNATRVLALSLLDKVSDIPF